MTDGGISGEGRTHPLFFKRIKYRKTLYEKYNVGTYTVYGKFQINDFHKKKINKNIGQNRAQGATHQFGHTFNY